MRRGPHYRLRWVTFAAAVLLVAALAGTDGGRIAAEQDWTIWLKAGFAVAVLCLIVALQRWLIERGVLEVRR